MKKSILLFPLILCSLSSNPVSAGTVSKSGRADADSIRPSSTVDLDQVVVTATRSRKTLKEVPVVTWLISADDIRKADATNVQDLLTERLPGLEFSYAMNQEVALSMNGFGAGGVLFLVDGERLAGETMGNVDFERLNLDNAGRIEIVRGAASALYGANAVAGVVNVISRESSQPWTVALNSRYRSMDDEWRNGLRFSINHGKWTSQTSLQHTRRDAVQLTDKFDMKSQIHEIYAGESLHAKERLVFRPSSLLTLTARGSYFSRTSRRRVYDDHYKDYSGGLKGVFGFSTDDCLELSYAYDQYDKSRTVDGIRTADHDYSNRQQVGHALYTHQFSRNNLMIGADCMHDWLTTYQFADNGSRSQFSANAYVQFDYNPLNWLNVVASLRHDYFSASRSDATTARLAMMTKWTGFSIRANYAGGFRAPTLKEMFMDFDMVGIQMIYGNPDLKSEHSNNFNLAFEHTGVVTGGCWAGHYNVTLAGTFTRYENRITTTEYVGATAASSGYVYCNDAHVSTTGVDFSAQYRLDSGLGLRLDYSGLHTSGQTIDRQYCQPRPHSATWRIDYDRQFSDRYGLSAALSGRWLSAADARDEETGGAYQLWKFSLQHRLWQGIRVNMTLDNIFNYRPKVYYYNSPLTTGTSWSVGVSLDLDRLI